MSALSCIECGQETDPNARDTLLEVTGFIKYRGARGGANHIIDQHKTGRMLCGRCAMRRQLHLPPKEQGTLL